MKLQRGFSILELVVVMTIIAILSKGGSMWLQYQRQQSYAQLLVQHLAIYESALSMYYSEHNGTLSANFTTNTQLKNIADLAPYFPYNFTTAILPIDCSFTLSIDSSNIKIILNGIPKNLSKLVDSFKKLVAKNCYSGRISSALSGNSYQITYILKDSSTSYL
ncbi:MAG: prepilin-type N-terminal cleavage/methylation domain-containing protein [Puniceicoccales bacterium]|jgi:prepilin-type N-terminal cleavage/methylation domain-containing protein|nr:prepilin-type N-terminal cleavage/methylation domain-containing protein [Puniceicoccales bacterium]